MKPKLNRRNLMLAGVSAAALAPLAASVIAQADNVAKPVVYRSEAQQAVFKATTDIMDLATKKYSIRYSETDRLRIPEQAWLEFQPLLATKYLIIEK